MTRAVLLARVLVMCSLAIVACGDDDDVAPSGRDSGADAAADGGTDSGVDARRDSGADGGKVDCDAKPTLGDYCGQSGRWCPASLEELREVICTPDSFTTRSLVSNDCGGQSVISRIGNSIKIYSFDASNHLVGVRVSDDVPFGSCRKWLYEYGDLCRDFPRFPNTTGAAPFCPGADTDRSDAGS